MGMFGELFKKEAKKMLSEALAGTGAKNGQGSNRNQSHNSHGSYGNQDSASYNREPQERETDEIKDRIRKVLSENYASYEVRENVPPQELGGTDEMRNYDFVLYSNGQVRLTILVLYGRSDYKRYAVRLSHEQSRKAGAECINVMDYLPSTSAYINERIGKMLSAGV